jgi:hypothetical protein
MKYNFNSKNNSMKYVFCFAFFLLFSFISVGQKVSLAEKQPDPTKKLLTVEASCGQCQFGMPGKGCNLAIRIDGQAHFIKGTDIDDHGDAHADDGFCEAIRMAEVQGELVNDTFNISYFKLGKLK